MQLLVIYVCIDLGQPITYYFTLIADVQYFPVFASRSCGTDFARPVSFSRHCGFYWVAALCSTVFRFVGLVLLYILRFRRLGNDRADGLAA